MTPTTPQTLRINEIFYSIQGESTWAGRPCVFVRLTGCHLRCRYCDTEYAFHEGEKTTIDTIMETVAGYPTDLVEVTGGEPLLQEPVHELMARLCDAGKTVLLETSGACDISGCDPRVIRILDFKAPGSGEVERNLWTNVEHLNKRDEVKFILTNRSDYDWARNVMNEHRLDERVGAVVFTAVAAQTAGLEIMGCEEMSLSDLAQWMLADGVKARLQTQLHKIIWDPQRRGV